MENLLIANIALDIFSIALCFLPILYLISDQRYKIRLNRYFMWFCLSNALMILGDIGDWAIRDITLPRQRILLTLLTLLYYIGSACALFCIAGYINEYIKAPKKSSRIFMITVSIFCSIQIVFTLISPLTGSVFVINESGYHRGNFFFLSQLIPFLNTTFCLIHIGIHRKKLSVREMAFFYFYLLIPMLGMILQILFRGVNIVCPLITLNMMVLFINIQYAQELALHRREKELAELQIDILLSQIQPHFLYNVLATISHLCKRDPDEARRSIKEFSIFLRGNMDSLYNRNPIPFDQEMNHVMNYLSLEQKRFQNRLRVVYDIQDSDFMIPPLTLQPVVENAVRHGILHREEGGVVSITAKKILDGHVVIITDNGVGIEKSKTFDTLGEHAHIGIDNVRTRIQTMMHGKIELESSDAGTTVTIWIPKEGA